MAAVDVGLKAHRIQGGAGRKLICSYLQDVSAKFTSGELLYPLEFFLNKLIPNEK